MKVGRRIANLWWLSGQDFSHNYRNAGHVEHSPFKLIEKLMRKEATIVDITDPLDNVNLT